jgi:hypothetical protein
MPQENRFGGSPQIKSGGLLGPKPGFGPPHDVVTKRTHTKVGFQLFLNKLKKPVWAERTAYGVRLQPQVPSKLAVEDGMHLEGFSEEYQGGNSHQERLR